MKLVGLLAFCLLFSSCASLEKSYKAACTAKNNKKTGYQDAINGLKPRNAELNECLREGYISNKTNYEAGYLEGLETFCTKEMGLTFGRQGKIYDVTCPPSRVTAFSVGYTEGKMEFDRLQVEKEKVKALKEANKKSKSAP